MSAADKVFAGSIPQIYDSHLVPLLFEAYAADLAARAAAGRPASVLETAAGSGVLTRRLAPLLAPSARYVVTDLNRPMLDRAIDRQEADARITWQQADALGLPFEDQSFDTVCCQFGAMFFPDHVAGYREARRVLEAGGRFLFNVWDRIETNDFARVVTDALATFFPADPPRFLARTPHGYHEVGRIEAQLRAAGFEDVEIRTLERTSTGPDARHVAIAYCQGTPLRNEIVARDPDALEAATDHVAAALASTYGEGSISARMQAHVIGARA